MATWGIHVPADMTDAILLVENEPLIAMDLEAMLVAAGFAAVDHVMSSEAALHWLEQGRARLAILDLQVSDGTTAPVAERLRTAGTPFVVYSGHTRETVARSTIFADAVWLSKPCSQSDLVLAIEQALRPTLR